MPSFKKIYQTEALKGLDRLSEISILAKNDVEHLPQLVKKYLTFCGCIGKPRVQNFHVEFIGRMKQKPNGNWMSIDASQYSFYDVHTRLFYIKSKLFCIPFDGLHLYVDGNATMNIKLVSLIPIVNSFGPVMDKSEMVTFFNDMCVMAPATLIDSSITWEEIDHLTIKGKFTNKGTTITAILYFNEEGALVNFESNDRSKYVDNNHFVNYKWSTPIKEYNEINGHRIPVYAEAIWHEQNGDFIYAQFNLKMIEYNVRKYSLINHI
ncbi:DUF6544 family protein [uncultured Methanomethylovorans sp.]|uniref:DUF6544 family protein n=1 Tax=uncultured Methanomethylovorans sp. TaxID=183759 RepID=UPI002AA5F76F|nr:DUF6544 family protein [uncultured Methanomethylovorans sp.]